MYVSRLCMLKKDQRWSRRMQQGAQQSLAVLYWCCSKKREGVGSFDALVPASAQVYIWIIFGFSGGGVVVVGTGVFSL